MGLWERGLNKFLEVNLKPLNNSHGNCYTSYYCIVCEYLELKKEAEREREKRFLLWRNRAVYIYTTNPLILFQYCMMEHYYGDNIRSLCCQREQIEEALQNLNRRELESIRQLLSFRPYLEKQDAKTKIDLFENDSFFRVALQKELNRLHDYVYSFYLCVRLLCEFVKDLPKNVMGKTVSSYLIMASTQADSEAMVWT